MVLVSDTKTPGAVTGCIGIKDSYIKKMYLDDPSRNLLPIHQVVRHHQYWLRLVRKFLLLESRGVVPLPY